jgi:hypothetical protein
VRAIAVLVMLLTFGCSSPRPSERPLHSPDYRELPPDAPTPATSSSASEPPSAERAAAAELPEGGYMPATMKRAGRWVLVYSPEPGREVRVWEDAWDKKRTRYHYKGGVLVLVQQE